MDLDVMSSKSRFRSVIEDFEQGKTDILIGTQMVTKGLDFANVKLVGVIDAVILLPLSAPFRVFFPGNAPPRKPNNGRSSTR